MLPWSAGLAVSRLQNLLGGVIVVTAAGLARRPGGEPKSQAVMLIPCLPWSSRGKGEMAVWLRNK